MRVTPIAATAGLSRKPAFWIAYTLVACASLVIAWRLFPLAIPIVNLEIRLDLSLIHI